MATVNPSGVQFLGHGSKSAHLAITVFRANKRKAAWFVTRYRLSCRRRTTIRRKRRSARLTGPRETDRSRARVCEILRPRLVCLYFSRFFVRPTLGFADQTTRDLKYVLVSPDHPIESKSAAIRLARLSESPTIHESGHRDDRVPSRFQSAFKS